MGGMYDPQRDLYAVLGVPAGSLPGVIRAAISRRHATVCAQDLARASRLLLSPALRARYDLRRVAHRTAALLTRLGRGLLPRSSTPGSAVATSSTRRWWTERPSEARATPRFWTIRAGADGRGANLRRLQERR
jgi:hypothetical protein